MSTEFEFQLSEFIDYCSGIGHGEFNNMFAGESFRGYEYMNEGSIYHDSLEEFFSVN